MTYTLILPKKNEKGNWLQLNLELEPYYQSCKQLIVDFRNVYFVDPDHLVILACYLEIFHQNSCQIEFINIKSAVKDYLERINYKRYFNCNNNKRPDFRDVKTNTTIPLWNIQKNEISSYSLFAKNFFTDSFFKTRDLLLLQSNLEEVFNNIFDHSDSRVNGFVTTQFYPDNNEIFCSICDIGTGIANKINQDKSIKGEIPVPDTEAIKTATIKGYSTKSIPQNKGLGLDNILDIPNNKQGNVIIVANRGYYQNISGIVDTQELNYTFSGTLISIRIDTTKLDEIDNEVYDYEF